MDPFSVQELDGFAMEATRAQLISLLLIENFVVAVINGLVSQCPTLQLRRFGQSSILFLSFPADYSAAREIGCV
jgi:hypothetical protein